MARISALSSGAILLNGHLTSLVDIDEELERVKEHNGIVWYYRENPEQKPPRQAVEVIQLVIKHELPISFSTRSDFSDYVDENGYSKPRQP